MRKLLFVSAATGVAVLLLGAPVSASAGTLDQQQTASNTSAGLFLHQSGAQTFTAGITGRLDQADLDLLKVDTPPATVTVEIRTTSAGSPTATVLASATIPTSAFTTDPAGAFVPVTFATPASVTAGTQYALVAWSPGSLPPGAVRWRYQSGGNPYSSGGLFLSNDPLPPGGTWTASADDDFTFKTYVTPPAPPSPPASTVQPVVKKKKCKKHKKHRSAQSAKKKKCGKKKKHH